MKSMVWFRPRAAGGLVLACAVLSSAAFGFEPNKLSVVKARKQSQPASPTSPKPAKLASNVRTQILSHIRSEAGVTASTSLDASPLATLTVRSPYASVGPRSFALSLHHASTDAGQNRADITRLSSRSDTAFTLGMRTEVGGLYLVDCSISSNVQQWAVLGEVNMTATQQAGHLLIPFVAVEGHTWFSVRSTQMESTTYQSILHECSITRAN